MKNETQSSASEDDPFYEQLPENERQVQELIFQWFDLLRMHPGYELYCRSRNEIDAELKCNRLKQRYPIIDDLYSDFGNLYTNELYDIGRPIQKGWQKWFATRLKIFVPDRVVSINPENVRPEANRILLSIPTEGTRGDKLDALKAFVDDYHYSFMKGKPNPLPLPKYKIRKELTGKTLKALEKAGFIYNLYIVNLREFALTDKRRKFSTKDIEDVILEHLADLKEMGFNWERNHKDGAYGSESNRAQIKRMHKEFLSWIMFSIQGKFPARIMPKP